MPSASQESCQTLSVVMKLEKDGDYSYEEPSSSEQADLSIEDIRSVKREESLVSQTNINGKLHEWQNTVSLSFIVDSFHNHVT